MPLVPGKEHIVMVEKCMILWDSVSRPEVSDTGVMKYKLNLVLPFGSPDTELIKKLERDQDIVAPWKGRVGHDTKRAITLLGEDKFDGEFRGCYTIRPSSIRMPQVYNDLGQRLDVIDYSPLLFQGQTVDVAIHCWHFSNRSSGVATGLDGIKIRTKDNSVPRSFGGDSVDMGELWGNQAF